VWTAFNQDRFTQKTVRVVQESEESRITYTAQIPVTGSDAADAALEGQTRAFLSSLSGGNPVDGSIVFTSDVRVFDAYVVVTLSSSQHQSFTSFGVDKSGTIDAAAVAERLHGAQKIMSEEQMIEMASATLTQRFPQARMEDMKKAVQNAFLKKSYRVAQNGLVLIIPANELIGVRITTPFHEVLVPAMR
jgi:hypothetical protein